LPPNRSAPLLLTSVTGPGEAAVALGAGSDILDVKQPREGSLGACPPAVLRAVVAMRDAAPGRAPGGGTRRAHLTPRPAVSAALGDAPNLPGTFALAAAGAAACGVDYLKVGLLGVRSVAEARVFLTEVVAAARDTAPSARVIAAAYADAAAVGSLPPRLLPRAAGLAGAHGCLIDTARKDGRSLFDHLDTRALAGFIAECRTLGLICGLAGSIAMAHVPRLRDLAPDVVGVRGALCTGGRTGRLDPLRLISFLDALRGRRAPERTGRRRSGAARLRGGAAA